MVLMDKMVQGPQETQVLRSNRGADSAVVGPQGLLRGDTGSQEATV
jgi:hypothetical protein